MHVGFQRFSTLMQLYVGLVVYVKELRRYFGRKLGDRMLRV